MIELDLQFVTNAISISIEANTERAPPTFVSEANLSKLSQIRNNVSLVKLLLLQLFQISTRHGQVENRDLSISKWTRSMVMNGERRTFRGWTRSGF